MRPLILIAASFASFPVLAASTMCTIENEPLAPKMIGWDTQSKRATIRDFDDREYVGEVALVRPHNEGVKVNLVFQGMDKPYQDSTEYVVFAVSPTEYRVMGVAYVRSGNEMRFDIEKGNFKAKCSSL